MMQTLRFCAIVKEIVTIQNPIRKTAVLDSRKGSISHVHRENQKIILL